MRRRDSGPLLWDSTIELGEKFFYEIIAHPLPIDMNILRSLKRSPLGLDLYLWLTYRTFNLKTPLCLSWRQIYRQFGADPSRVTAGRVFDASRFRAVCLRELKKIKTRLAGPVLSHRHGWARHRSLAAVHPAGTAPSH